MELTKKQKHVMDILRENGPQSLYWIKNETGMHSQSVSCILVALEKKGYITIPVKYGRRFFNKLKIVK